MSMNMKCTICGVGTARIIKKLHQSRYKEEPVEVEIEAFHCDQCGEDFMTPEQARTYSNAVKNEVRKRHGLLSPEKIMKIRKHLKLTQEQLEQLLGIGSKVVVRWESGKVVQSKTADITLRLLESDKHAVKKLQEIEKDRSREQQKYAHARGAG